MSALHSTAKPPGFATRCVHAGQQPDPTTGAVVASISLSTTFAHKTPGELYSLYGYARSGNPTRAALEAAVASLEGGAFGLAFASGNAATAAVVHLLRPGDHIISVNDIYGGTYRYFTSV